MRTLIDQVEYMDAGEAAATLGIARDTVGQQARKGRLVAYREYGRATRPLWVTVESVAAYPERVVCRPNARGR